VARSDLSTPSAEGRCTPILRLIPETLVVGHDGEAEAFHEVQTAALELSFDYRGVRVRASDPNERVRAGAGWMTRDREAEHEARRILEAFGPIEISSLEDCAPPPGSDFDYVIDPAGERARLCAFNARAIPKLRELGWQVEVDGELDLEVIDGGDWFAELVEDEPGWFELQLGVECGDRRVDLLPVLVEIITRKGGLDRISRGFGRNAVVDLGERRHLVVPAERLRVLLEIVSELHGTAGKSERGALRVPDSAPLWLDRIDDALRGDAIGDAPKWRGRERMDPAYARMHEPIEPTHAPNELRATLRPYQEIGLAFMQRIRETGLGGVLADDMGLGKTLQTIAHLVAEKASGRMTSPALVVTPTSLVGNWSRELQRFAPGLRVLELRGATRHERRLDIPEHDVVLTTYPLVVRDRAHYVGVQFHAVIADEAQLIKNVRSQAHQAVKSLDAGHRISLTGTPIENNLDELWAQFDLLVPGLLGDHSRFRTAYRIPIERDGNARRLESLRERIAPFVLRRMKDQVATELPPKTEIVRSVDLTGDQRDLYEGIRIAGHAAVRKAVRERGLAASTIDILGALMKLRQACCDPRLVKIGAARQIEESAKLSALTEMIEQQLAGGRRILVFSQFATMLGIIAGELARMRVPTALLTGATTDRDAVVQSFQQGKADVFLISLKAGGTGLNLTRADTVIHYDPWWNPAAQKQATDRAYRIGQTNAVFVYQLIVAGSVEERMLRLQQRKQSLADALLGRGASRGLPWSEGDVDDLFAPLT
jgi:superfamily II DNA or RNA helicase